MISSSHCSSISSDSQPFWRHHTDQLESHGRNMHRPSISTTANSSNQHGNHYTQTVTSSDGNQCCWCCCRRVLITQSIVVGSWCCCRHNSLSLPVSATRTGELKHTEEPIEKVHSAKGNATAQCNSAGDQAMLLSMKCWCWCCCCCTQVKAMQTLEQSQERWRRRRWWWWLCQSSIKEKRG